MVDQLNGFAAEVTRVAREVGTEGKLGGQAEVKDVSGVWKDLTDNVNSMASNLTGQVRNISEVTIAVANGGTCPRKITVDVTRRDPAVEGGHQYDGRPAAAHLPPRSRAWRAKWAPRANSVARQSYPESVAPGRT